jgi:diguanylate cyclase (GGDEF)-like protein
VESEEPQQPGGGAEASAYAQVQDLKVAFLENAWLGCMIAAMVMTPLSLARIPQTGWTPVYGVHVGISAGLFFGYVFRHRIPHYVKLSTLTLCLGFVGVSGTLHLGLMGIGVWFLAIIAILMGVAHSPRVGLSIFVLNMVFLCACAVAFIRGDLVTGVDPVAYSTSAQAWTLLIISSAFMPALVLFSFGKYQQTLLALVYDMERQRDLIAEEAMYDELTRLPRRQLLFDRIEMLLRRVARHETRGAVLFLDLDDFKQVNDTHGHRAGDAVLLEVASRLKKSLRADDTVARVGGDEFVVLLGDMETRDAAGVVAQKLVEAVREPIKRGNLSIVVGLSVGIAMLPEDGQTSEALYENADAAMYRAKESGKNSYRFYAELEVVSA